MRSWDLRGEMIWMIKVLARELLVATNATQPVKLIQPVTQDRPRFKDGGDITATLF